MSVKLTIMMQLNAHSIDAHALADFLGLEPTSSWKTGDPVGKSPVLTHERDGWVRVVPTTETMDIAPGLCCYGERRVSIQSFDLY